MLNEPPDQQRRSSPVHPLEREPVPRPAAPASQSVMLHIPVVKPYITYALIAINVIIFLIGFAEPQLGERLLREGATNHNWVLRDGEYLRLLFAMFLHGGVAHVFFNMYLLFYVGRVIEGYFGHARFVVIYFLGGMTGSLLSALLNDPRITSVGASGAVFAVVGAEIIYLYQHRKLLGENGRRQLQNVLMLAGLNLVMGIASTFNSSGVQIDNWGHIGGLLGGMVLAWYIGPLFLPRKHPHRENALIAEDINPLRNRSQIVSIYITVWLAVLIIATLATRS